MRPGSAVLGVLLLVLACLPADARNASRYGLPRDIPMPSVVTLDAYVPASVLEGRIFVRNQGYFVDSGSEVRAAVTGALATFVTDGKLVDLAAPRPTGLLLVLHPRMQFEGASLRQTVRWQVFGPGGVELARGEQLAVEDTATTMLTDAVRDATAKALRGVFVDVLTKLRPDATKFPPTLAFSSIPVASMVDRENAITTGTGFFVNEAGELLTAAHVLRDCLLVEAKHDGAVLPATVRARSDLLDLAVVGTGKPVARHLPFREAGDIVLGEPVTNVGFPLQSILAASPNLTRGNVSSRGALAGAAGQFQFSAPIQPGSSGGPVVSDGGEVLGVTVATLNVSRLIESGALPQNVNFALEGRYATMFLKKNEVAFSTRPANPNGSITVANEAALSTVVSLSCYQ